MTMNGPAKTAKNHQLRAAFDDPSVGKKLDIESANGHTITSCRTPVRDQLENHIHKEKVPSERATDARKEQDKKKVLYGVHRACEVPKWIDELKTKRAEACMREEIHKDVGRKTESAARNG